MSAFWGGFAAEGVKQLDKLREDNTVKLRIEDARKYQESRYSLERADRKADATEEWNADQKVNEATDVKGIYPTEGGNYMRRTMSRGADGNITIGSEQVTDPGLISQYLEYDAAKKQKAEDDKWDTVGKRARAQKDVAELGSYASDKALDRQEQQARIASYKDKDNGKDKDSSDMLPDYAYKAINGLAAGDDSYEYTGSGVTVDGKKFNARDMARIAADPSHKDNINALVFMRRYVLPKTNKKIKTDGE